ncbi:MAG: hypothetical protein KBT03_06890 [Bacteroidales bacterium]|nr:hypothetical protein [Candidatus Scybalousia scybalohippi]
MELDNVSNVLTDDTSNVNVDDTTNNDGDNLFEGLEPTEETNDVVEESNNDTPVDNTAPADVTTTEGTNADVKPFSLNISYRGEKKTLNEDEARMYSQKGMNYDHIFEPLQKLAKLNGMKVEEYLNKLNDFEFEKGVGDELNALREKYPDTPEEVLNELAQKRVMENQNLQFKRLEEEARGKDEALEAEVKRQIDVFKKEYPGLEPDKLDAGVYEFVKDGYTLTEAYTKWFRQQEQINKPIIEAQEKVNKLNEENKKKSLGNVTNAGSESSEYDDFFKGMDSI